jgi:hypothetical protein
MIVDLNNLPYRQARELILWCVANDIDKERADKLYFAWYEPAGSKKEYTWELDIPEEYLTYFMLKWQ